MIEAAEADVVGPAVTTHHPDAFANQCARETLSDRAGQDRVREAESGLQIPPNPGALGFDAGFRD